MPRVALRWLSIYDPRLRAHYEIPLSSHFTATLESIHSSAMTERIDFILIWTIFLLMICCQFSCICCIIKEEISKSKAISKNKSNYLITLFRCNVEHSSLKRKRLERDSQAVSTTAPSNCSAHIKKNHNSGSYWQSMFAYTKDCHLVWMHGKCKHTAKLMSPITS